MKVKITEDFAHFKKGETVEVSDYVGTRLIKLHKVAIKPRTKKAK